MGIPVLRAARDVVRDHLNRFHRDEQGPITFIGIFACIMFTLFLALVLNSGANLHEKMRMQNAADAASLAAAQVMADSMNTISDNNVAISELLATRALSLAVPIAAAQLVNRHYSAFVAARAAAMIYPALRPVAEYFRFLTNYDTLILQNSNYFSRTVPNICDGMINVMQTENMTLTLTSRSTMQSVANQNGQQNNARKIVLAGTEFLLPVERGSGGASDWFAPTYFGSQPTAGEGGRRGYYYVYNGEFPLGKGPFQTQGQNWRFLTPWRPAWMGPFRSTSMMTLYQTVNAMDGVYDLKDFALAYEECGVVAVAFGHEKAARLIAGSKSRDLHPFARRLSGFDQPYKRGALAVAQAQVYNPISWDLFSQYWDIKLTRTKRVPMINDSLSVLPILPDTQEEGLYH